MDAEGPVPTGTGPSASDAEMLRRRLYAQGGGSSSQVEAYRHAVERPGSLDRDVVPTPAPVRAGARKAAAIPVLLCVAAIAAVVVALALRPVPAARIVPPALDGTTVAAYGRAADPATSAGSVTFQPQGYTVFNPAGRTVRLAFRCVGEGQVRLVVEAVHRFRCTAQERTFVRSEGRQYAPFMVLGRTTGNVVWATRVVLTDG